jgi:membrane-associated protein
MIPSNSAWLRRVAFALVFVFTLPSLWFALRTYGSFELLRSAYQAGAPETSSIRAWMTLAYIAGVYHVDASALMRSLGLESDTDPNITLRSAADQAKISPFQYVGRVQRAVAALVGHGAAASARQSSGWLGTLGDEVLSAMLVYGYPILALIQLAGAIGAPVPDGIAGAVAGSLAAQGRMNVVAAGLIIVVCAVLGDIVGYGIGRLLSRNFLDRHGRWLGYTPARGARVQRLFAQWGLVTVFITRTFVSYLSSVASLLAGVSRYRVSKFLSVAVMGRMLWSAAYLGLGYVIGTDFEAATGFLGNLSGFLICATICFVLSISLVLCPTTCPE